MKSDNYFACLLLNEYQEWEASGPRHPVLESRFEKVVRAVKANALRHAAEIVRDEASFWSNQGDAGTAALFMKLHSRLIEEADSVEKGKL